MVSGSWSTKESSDDVSHIGANVCPNEGKELPEQPSSHEDRLVSQDAQDSQEARFHITSHVERYHAVNEVRVGTLF